MVPPQCCVADVTSADQRLPSVCSAIPLGATVANCRRSSMPPALVSKFKSFPKLGQQCCRQFKQHPQSGKSPRSISCQVGQVEHEPKHTFKRGLPKSAPLVGPEKKMKIIAQKTEEKRSDLKRSTTQATLTVKMLGLHMCKLSPSQLKQSPNVSAEGTEVSEKTSVGGWESLPSDIHDNILRRLPFDDAFRLKTLSKSFKDRMESNTFAITRGLSREGLFTAINSFIKGEEWQCTGFDLQTKTWRRLPTLSCLPKLDALLFKEYSVCGDRSLMCANVSKLPQKEKLVVFNPFTGKTRQLPPLHYPRNPVLTHILVDYVANSYKVLVAGSSSSSHGEGEEHLSRRVEVLDSRTSRWEVATDIPGPEFGLNEHQAGVCVDGILYFVAFLKGLNGQRGVLAFDVEKGECLEDRTCPVPFSSYSNILQLVENNGKVYLFSEQEQGGIVEHSIELLEYSAGSNAEVACQLRNVVKVRQSRGRGLQVYPENTCVPYGEGKLCIFNTINRDGEVYDVEDGRQCEVLPPPPKDQRGEGFYCLNPLSFTLQPNFICDPEPPIVFDYHLQNGRGVAD